MNSKDVTERDLESALTDALTRVDPRWCFPGRRKVLLGDMVRILEIAKLAGAEQIAIAAKRVTPVTQPAAATRGGTTGG